MDQLCINGLGQRKVNKNNIEDLKRLLTHHEVEIELLEDKVKELDHKNKELEGHWKREKEFKKSLFCISGTIAARLYKWIQLKRVSGCKVFDAPEFQDFFMSLSDYCRNSPLYGSVCCSKKEDEGCMLGEPENLGGLRGPMLAGTGHTLGGSGYVQPIR